MDNSQDLYAKLVDAFRHVADALPPEHEPPDKELIAAIDCAITRLQGQVRRVGRAVGYVPAKGRKRMPVDPAVAQDLVAEVGKVEAARRLKVSRTTLNKVLDGADREGP